MGTNKENTGNPVNNNTPSNSVVLNLNDFLEKTYAGPTANMIDKNVAPRDCIKPIYIDLINVLLVKTCSKGARVNVLGIVKPILFSGLKLSTTNHINGIKNAKANRVNIR